MGYCIEQDHAEFEIKQANKGKALAALKSLAEVTVKENRRLRWVEPMEILEAATLKEAMDACRWDLNENDAGDVNDISFSGEKIGSDEELFDVIAPYVEEGSYIEMQGEDGAIWRWVFKKGKCLEIPATVSFNG